MSGILMPVPSHIIKTEVLSMIRTIENSILSLSYDSSINNVVELRNKATGDNYIKTISDNTVFSFWCLRKGGVQKEKFVPSEPVVFNKTPCGEYYCLELLYRGLSGNDQDINVDVKVTISINADNNIQWKMELKNNENDFDIVEVLFPHIRGIYLGGTWKDDTVIYPHHAGEKTLNPVEEYTSDRYLNFWRANTRLEDSIYYREINYCGLASMMWMYYYDSENGFYISSNDNDFLVTGMRVETGGASNPWMGFGIRKHTTIKAGQVWKSKSYIMAVNCEDWHWGAKTYRKWIEPFIEVNNNPSFLKEEHSLNQCYNFKKDGKIHNRFDKIPEIFNYGKQKYDMRHLFIASWNRKGFDCNYPEYYPDMELGTSMDLYNGCKYVNDNGGFVTFYINARIFDVASDFFPTLGKAMSIKREDGNDIYEEYGPVRFAVMCPSDVGWQKHLIDTAAWMVKSYGATGIYLDQLGSAEPFPCYDNSHSHEDIGDFNRGYLHIIKELKEKLGKLNRNAFLMIENCGDIYGSYVWGSLTWNGDPYDEYFNVYKYTFPEFVQINMVNPKMDKSESERTERFYKDMERALLSGSVLWLGITYKFKEGDEEYKLYAEKAINFRKKINVMLKDGVYEDNIGIADKNPGINASRWKLKDGNELIIVGNRDRRGGCRINATVEKPVDIYSEDIDGNRLDLEYEYDAGHLDVNLPESRILYIIVKIR